MNKKISLSKSLYLNGLQCQKYLWLKIYGKEKLQKPDANLKAIFKTGNEVDDPVYKGEFLVKRVRHDFDYTLRSHRTNYVLVKDSIETAIPDDGEDEFSPSAKNSYFEDKETFYPKRVN